MFDPWKQVAINTGLDRIRNTQHTQTETSLDDLRTLSGVKAHTVNVGSNISVTATEKAELMKTHDIKPGTPEWFKLWFSKPYLTGEQPYSK